MPDQDDGNAENRLKRRETAPYWWPDAQTFLQVFLAVAIVVLVAYVVRELLDGATKIDSATRELLFFIFGIIMANFKDVFGFTFGSSASGKKKDETINRSMESKDKIIAAGVEATAATAALATDNALAAAAAAAPAAAAAAAPAAAQAAAPPVVNEVVPPAVEKAVNEAMDEVMDELNKDSKTSPKP